jgi:hypothetical protein
VEFLDLTAFGWSLAKVRMTARGKHLRRIHLFLSKKIPPDKLAPMPLDNLPDIASLETRLAQLRRFL